MNVLSLFDGMSVGRLALQEAGIKVDNYFASEIDEYAMSVSRYNFPSIKHIGDVTKVKGNELPKIDLLIGGSPCQGFSFAGKQLNFSDPRSILFFEYVRILNETKPRYFFLENVVMKKESEEVITRMLGVEPIKINSKLVSAQSRGRLYWTNIPNVTIPEDEGILLKDILIGGKLGFGAAKRGRYNSDGTTSQRVEVNGTQKSNALTTVQKDSLVIEAIDMSCTELSDKIHGRLQLTHEDVPENSCVGTTKPEFRTIGQRDVVFGGNQKMGCLMASDYKQPKQIYFEGVLRKLHPIECERLQTLPDDYTKVGIDPNGKEVTISNTQRFKMIGNGWTAKVITHFFKNMEH